MKREAYLFAADASVYAEDAALYERHFSALPNWRQEKAEAYVFPKDRHLSLGVYRLFAKACALLNLDPAECHATVEGALTAFHYCVSFAHSGTMVFVAISPSAVGCDVEEDRGPRDVPASFFSAAERAYLKAHPEGFYRVWTLKESLAKAHGLGLDKLALLPEIDPGQEACGGVGGKDVFYLYHEARGLYHYACVSKLPIHAGISFLSLQD